MAGNKTPVAQAVTVSLKDLENGENRLGNICYRT